jgi:hypothetical protein
VKQLLCAASFVVASMATPGPGARADEVEVNFVYLPAPEAETLLVEQPMGGLRLSGWDKPQVRITSRKHAADPASLERLRVQVDMRDGHIQIRTGVYVRGVFKELPPAVGEASGIDLSIDAPKNVHLAARTWSGDLEASGFRSGAELTSTGGEVRARDIDGRVQTNADFGRQRLSSIRGSVDAHTLKGDMDLESLDGEQVDARVAEGQITARDLHAAMVRLLSTAGNIVLIGTLRPGGRYELTALDGDVQLRLQRGPFRVNARGEEVRTALPIRPVAQSRALLRGELAGPAPGSFAPPQLELTAARRVLLDPY